MKPVVFLDMDGVLTHFLEQFYTDPELQIDENFIHPDKGRLFANWINDNDLQVVLSSDWRKREKYSNSPAVFEEYFFESTGCRIPVIGFTPVIGYRGMEIQKYCTDHNITNYVIIDDCVDMLPDQMTRFVNVNHLNGLTISDLVIASNMLNLDNELAQTVKWIKWHNAYKYYRPSKL